MKVVITYDSHSMFFININSFFKSKGLIVLKMKGSFRKTINRILLKTIFKKSEKIYTTQLLVDPSDNVYAFYLLDMLTFEDNLIFGETKDKFIGLNNKIIRAAKKAKYVITISEYSKKKILEFIDIDPNKIIVNYISLESETINGYINKRATLKKAAQEHGINNSSNNILFIGSPHTRKNLKQVINSFIDLKEMGFDTNLIIISSIRQDIKETWGLYNKYKNYPNIHWHLRVSEDVLYALYLHANLFVLPTIEEGFGMPNLEAQYVGLPVISSNVSCIPEILKESAMLVDPFDVKDLSEKIKTMLENENIRNKYVTLGLENAKRFVSLGNRAVEKILSE